MAQIDKYLMMMVKHGASDLHFCTGCKPIFRKDGSMMALRSEEDLDSQATRTVLYEIMPPANEQQFNDSHDTDFAYSLEGYGRFRVNVFMDHKGMGAVFRVIPTKILSCEELGLPDSVKKFCGLTKGLVLVTGPTGSGKSTTLAAMIDLINSQRSEHIITIEDPIEFVHPNKSCLINQREVHNHTKGFKAALRAALREDPDIVLVGEMRDLETTHIAIETAETGHLVFGTLHTTTAISTVDRLIDQFPSDQQQQIRTMLAGTLKGVVAQNLLKKKGGGRVAALEVMVVNAAVASLIREAKTNQIMSIMQTAKKEGMTILNEELARFCKEDVIEPEEAWRKAVDKEGFLKSLESAGVNFKPPAE
ncbi:MAG TPA: type IV pilus twitching motility protein PilT [Candidatus Hydrogenedentes bacterium]|nr:type IV pilus twitching motility protein PilT [Candidatus Hydrogenedentota bacterium]